jgi:PadR family transcriptional regulator PadR
MAKTLGDFETLLLLAVVRLKGQAYGATIHREIETRTGRSIAVGAVYTGLARLQRTGMVTAAVGEPTAERGGRRKKFYRLEPEGSAALAQALQTHHRMTEGIEEELEILTARHARDQ